MQDSTLAGRLRKLRGNEPRRVFSLKYGMHEQSLIRYEKGTRTPDNDIIRRIAEGEKVSFDWLHSGDGPMRLSEEGEGAASDMSEVLRGVTDGQLIENVDLEKKETSDMSEGLRLRQKLEQSLEKMVELQERLLALTEQNADLRLQLKERDLRIRELERENAGLREALKGAAAVQREAAGWQAG